MLLQNLQVGRHILNNVAKSLASGLRFSKKAPTSDRFVKQSEVKIRNITPGEYETSREQCRRPSFKQLCEKFLFPEKQPKINNPSSKCEITTASDDYLNARRTVELRAKNIIQHVESESRSIAGDIETRLEASKAARAAQLRELFERTSGKLDEVMKRDVSYGFWMRKETLLLNDEIGRSFDAVERTVASNVRHVTLMLGKLRDDVLRCARQTEEGLATCRRHGAPSELAECVREQLSGAAKTLDRANEEARLKLGHIGRYRDTFMGAHEATTRETLELNRKKADELLKYMEKCIAQLRKSSKD